MKKFYIGAIIAMALLLTGCQQKVVDNSEVGLRYEHGRTQGTKFNSCMAPGRSIETNDDVYRYPRNQRNWKFQTGGRGADEESVEFISSDGVPMVAVLNAAFVLNTSCKDITVDGKLYKGGVIQLFHELIGRTRHAYFRDDGTYKVYPADQDKGWGYVLSQTVGLPVRKLFRTYGTQYDAAALWFNTPRAVPDSDVEKLPTDDVLSSDIESHLEKASGDFTETDQVFFKDFQVEITDVHPTTESGFAKQYLDRKAAQTKAETAELNKTAKVTEANANAAVRRAEINGYPSYDAWLKAQMVEKGMNPLQPTIVGGGVVGSNQ